MSNMNLLIRGRRAIVGALVVALTTLGGLVMTPGVASATSFSSFNAGVFAPRQVKHVWWNNANSDAYAPGLRAVGADDPDVICDVEIIRTWYQRHPSGEREFHLEIKGDFLKPCQVTVWLARLSMFRESSTGDLAPGQSRAWFWNNAHSDQNVYLVGVLASQVAAGTCAIEVTTQYRTQPDGENEFVYRAHNVGDVACSAQLRHVSLGVGHTVNTTTVPSGSHLTVFPHLFPASTKVVVAGAAPAAVASPCQIGIDTTSYTRPGSVHVGYTNTGAVSCSLKATFALL